MFVFTSLCLQEGSCLTYVTGVCWCISVSDTCCVVFVGVQLCPTHVVLCFLCKVVSDTCCVVFFVQSCVRHMLCCVFCGQLCQTHVVLCQVVYSCVRHMLCCVFCAQLCPTHVVLCFYFVFLRLMLPISLYYQFFIASSVFPNVSFFNIVTRGISFVLSELR